MPPGPISNATRATRLARVAVILAAPSIVALSVIAYGVSHPGNAGAVPMPSLADVSPAATYMTFVGAPTSLLLSVLAMKARARCLNPRPRTPVVALLLSTPLVVGAVLLVFLLFILAAFDHPGS